MKIIKIEDLTVPNLEIQDISGQWAEKISGGQGYSRDKKDKPKPPPCKGCSLPPLL